VACWNDLTQGSQRFRGGRGRNEARAARKNVLSARCETSASTALRMPRWLVRAAIGEFLSPGRQASPFHREKFAGLALDIL
jgi:hypothetical protein